MKASSGPVAGCVDAVMNPLSPEGVEDALHRGVVLAVALAAEVLDPPETVEAWPEDAFDSGDGAFMTHALGIVRARKGMSQPRTGERMSRQAFYKALSAVGHPKFESVLKVADAFGFKLHPSGFQSTCRRSPLHAPRRKRGVEAPSKADSAGWSKFVSTPRAAPASGGGREAGSAFPDAAKRGRPI